MITQQELDLAVSKCAKDRTDDCWRIKLVAKKNGLEMTLRAAEEAWLVWSDFHCASWLYLPKDKGELGDVVILEAIEYFVEHPNGWSAD